MGWKWLLLIAFVGWAIAYVMVRPYLRQTVVLKPFYDWAEPWEQLIWRHSRMVLFGRLVTFVSFIIAVHDLVAPSLAGFDWTPFIPAEYQKYTVLAGVIIGPLIELLRGWTTTSLEAKRQEAVAEK